MDFKTRRSIRKFKDVPVEKEKVQEILKAALLAPTGKNSRACEFAVIDDKKIIAEIPKMREHGASFTDKAPLIIAVMGEKEKSTTLLEDCSIAGFAIQVKAHELGLGSCWVQVNNRKTADGMMSEDYFKNLIEAPENIKVMCLIVIGYPDEEKPHYTENDINWNKVSYNKYGNR